MEKTNLWFPFYIGDYRANTQGLSHEERGIFIDLLCAYTHWQQPLPDDDKKLAKLCGISNHKWKKVKPSIQSIFTIKQGGWHLPKLDEQIARGVEIKKKRAEAGRRGGLKSAAKRQANAQAIASSESKQLLNQSQSQSHKPPTCKRGRGVELRILSEKNPKISGATDD